MLSSQPANRRFIVADARKVFEVSRVCCNLVSQHEVSVVSTVSASLMVS